MIGRTNTGGGGGSGGLNFQVIGGTTAPNNPKENTIWVNTSTKITGWVFSATQPTGATGMVWISTGASSPVAFNALKKNNITVYPISAKQYVSGAWVEKTAQVYKNGAWADFAPEPFYIFKSGEGALVAMNKYTADGQSVSIGTDYIEFKITGGGQAGNVRTSTTVDLSGRHSKLCCLANCTNSNGERPMSLGFSRTAMTDYDSALDVAYVSFNQNSTNTTYSVPIPEGLTEAYVGIKGGGDTKIYDIWLE